MARSGAEHRTLEIGLRSWVERQASQRLGYVEQLYTFGDRDRLLGAAVGADPALTVAYLALVREMRPAGSAEAVWHSWYRYFPWEDWRDGKPPGLAPIEAGLAGWTGAAPNEAEARLRAVRIQVAFGLHAASWNEELVLERYELLYEAGLVAEAARGRGQERDGRAPGATGAAMAVDHRRILATAVGRLRGKIKYRPVVFEADAARVHPVGAAAHGRGAGRRPPAQAELPPPRRAAGPGRGDRRDQRRDRRPPRPPGALPPRSAARAPGPRPAPQGRKTGGGRSFGLSFRRRPAPPFAVGGNAVTARSGICLRAIALFIVTPATAGVQDGRQSASSLDSPLSRE